MKPVRSASPRSATLIKAQEIEGIVKIKLARSLLGRPFYFTTAY